MGTVMKHHQLQFQLQEGEVLFFTSYFFMILIFIILLYYFQLHLMVQVKQEEHLEDLVQDTLHIK